VADGYGRNYLLPHRYAVPNTPENRLVIESEKLEWLRREAQRKERAGAAVKQLKNALLQCKMKAQDDGTLYGSVNAGVVVSVIREAKGLEIEERWIQLADPIKKIGDYDIDLAAPEQGSITFKLTVLPED
jgi:large subunit ribosomal protein L9